MEYVLITGGTSGIGFELARKFAAEAYGIVLVSSNKSRLENAKDKIESEFNVPVYIFDQDLGKVGSPTALYNNVKSNNINISILINNAGFGLAGSTDKIPFNKDEKMMILNVISVVELCKLFIKDMYKEGKGKILNVASTGAFQPGPYTSTYFASKSFVLSYSKAIRYEAKKKGVEVCTLCPGSTKTNFFINEGKTTPKNAMSSTEVAACGYEMLMRNKEICIPGIINKLQLLLPGRMKSYFVAKMKS